MKTNLIVGAGQLGSRHLQGLLRLELQQHIYILDPSAESLDVAKARATEISHNHKLEFVSTWEGLPKKFDLVIVATGANVRAKVVTHLLESHDVEFLVLEKILFQDLESYDVIGQLLHQTNTSTWVNHSRRLYKHYIQIRKEIAQSGEKVVFQAFGANWGLGCSALHYIDIAAFISGSPVVSTDMDWIDPVVYEGKRANCIEFTGSVKGAMENGSNFTVTSLDGELADVTVMIATNSNRWVLHEGVQKMIRVIKDNIFCGEITDFTNDYQSTLTCDIAAELFATGSCGLPTYEEACASHIPFIDAAIKKYNLVSGLDGTFCPIT